MRTHADHASALNITTCPTRSVPYGRFCPACGYIPTEPTRAEWIAYLQARIARASSGKERRTFTAQLRDFTSNPK